ncbi:MAG: tRNA-dihydrouridine synthase family protein [Treponema sp.]|nr:tRNA-dihydrouridine synthase family protein [Treponema sp.]
MKLICGPMATISHPAFRILIERFGCCDEYFTEMINAGTLLTGGPFEKFYLDATPVPQKIVWQLTGKSNPLMISAAEQLVELPGIGLDLNMGCSAPDIYRFGAGIAWMLKPLSETQEMVRGVKKVIENHNSNTGNHKRLSVKLRLGDEDFTDQGFYDFCDMLISEGVEQLTLHPRTKKEKLSRPPRYFYCEELCKRYQKDGISIILNGNITNAASAQNAITKAPSVDGIMISRAAVEKPWIFYQLNQALNIGETAPKDSNQPIDFLELVLNFIDDVEKYQPKEFWKTRLQRFFTYFSNNFQFSHYAQTQFLNAKDNEDLRNRLSLFFEKCPDERYFSI